MEEDLQIRHSGMQRGERSNLSEFALEANAQARQLQAATSAPAAAPATSAPAAASASNDDYPEFTVGKWTKCTCYQACVQGVRTRDVTCLSSTCKAPKPEESEKCECKHCSNCQVLLSATIFWISFLTQSVVSILVWLSLLYMGTFEEASLVSLSWFQWFLGFFVKQLPPLTRLLLIVNIGQAIFMVLQTWVPSTVIKFEPDCNDVADLRFLSILLLSVIVVLILLGRLTRLFNKMMPFLYRPHRSNSFILFRWWSKVQASLGP
jgi:hypothetical protein